MEVEPADREFLEKMIFERLRIHDARRRNRLPEDNAAEQDRKYREIFSSISRLLGDRAELLAQLEEVQNERAAAAERDAYVAGFMDAARAFRLLSGC